MQARWGNFVFEVSDDGPMMIWRGRIRGFQRDYRIQVQWSWKVSGSQPFVFILDPVLKPRLGQDFIDLPHLIYNEDKPEDSALCLFDPETGEWSNRMLIADSTVPWASEWLHHYEIWHVTGVWSGPNAPGPISVGEIRRELEKCDV